MRPTGPEPLNPPEGRSGPTLGLCPGLLARPVAAPRWMMRAEASQVSRRGSRVVVALALVLVHQPVQGRPVDARETRGLRHFPPRSADQASQILLLKLDYYSILCRMISLVHYPRERNVFRRPFRAIV